MAAWREAAKAAGISPPPGERFLGGFVQRREATLLRNNTRHAIAPSNKAKLEIERSYDRTGATTVVPHGFPSVVETTDTDAARTRLNLPPALTALFVGDTRKGLKVAIQAVAATPPVQLAIVSRSSPVEHLAYARSLGAGDRVHWLGELKDPSLAYSAADVLLHPTVYDTFGLVVAEAMAHGVPVVVTEHAGISELISHRRDGWIVSGDLAAGTMAALAELSAETALRNDMGRAAKATAATRDWDTVARETLAVYEQVAQK
jgi:UDP-glucose:(heptosyl)LPS alpha-1,3-glucosyltransferase